MAYHGLSLPSSSSEQKFMVQFVVPPGIWQLGVDRQPQRSGCIKERLMIKTMKSRGKNKRMAKHSAASKYRINKRLWKIAMLLPCSGSKTIETAVNFSLKKMWETPTMLVQN